MDSATGVVVTGGTGVVEICGAERVAKFGKIYVILTAGFPPTDAERKKTGLNRDHSKRQRREIRRINFAAQIRRERCHRTHLPCA